MKLSSIPLLAVKKKNLQPQIILIFLSLLIPAEVYVLCFFFFFQKANTPSVSRIKLYAEAWILPLTYTEHIACDVQDCMG